MAENSFSKKIKLVNQRLKGAKLGISILQRGNRLYIRGTFPPKPGSTKTAAHQQEIALKIHANPQGLQQAEKEAKKVAAALAFKQFDWFEYLPRPTAQPQQQTIADCIAAFETDYFQRRQRSPKSESTWRVNYSTYFRRLPQDQPLTLEVLERVILTTTADSSARCNICQAFRKLAEFMGLEVKSITRLKGSYSSKSPTPRNIPSDEEVVQWFDQISDPVWKWAYGMLATYGLRPHEVFCLDTQEMENGGMTISVLPGTKTGARLAFPLHPEWIERFNLREKQILTPIGKNFSQISSVINRRFKKVGIPFYPYDLRHAWAVRACLSKINVTFAARWMGHSVNIHTNTYHKWISPQIQKQVYEEALQSRGLTSTADISQQPLLEIQPQHLKPVELIEPAGSSTIEVKAEEVKAEPGTVVLPNQTIQASPVVQVRVPKPRKRNAQLIPDDEFQQLDLLSS